MDDTEFQEVKNKVLKFYDKADIILTDNEKSSLEIVDFGLGDIYTEGLQLITYVNNHRYCAKEMVLLPEQTCPEHRHPTRKNGDEGKMETFRCRYGKVYLFVEGDKKRGNEKAPRRNSEFYTASKEIILLPGEQYTIPANTRHWFQAGKNGAVISEFSSNSEDSSDVFTNSRVVR